MGSYCRDTFGKPIKMKFILPFLAAVATVLTAVAQTAVPEKGALPHRATTRRLFIITIDGFRWQEVFTGADPLLVSNVNYVRDTALTCQQYWDPTAEGRRRK